MSLNNVVHHVHKLHIYPASTPNQRSLANPVFLSVHCLTCTTVFKPLPTYLGRLPSPRHCRRRLSVQTVGTCTRFKTRRGESHHRSKNGPEWHKLAGPGWLARSRVVGKMQRHNACRPSGWPEWWTGSLRSLGKLVNLAGPGTSDPTLARDRKEARARKKSFSCHPSFRGALPLGLDPACSLFSARQHPH